MGSAKPSDAASDRAKWDAIFAGMVKLLKNQQWQLETLLSQKKSLENYIKNQNEAWVSNLRVHQLYISELKSRLEEKEMERLMEAAKSELLVGLRSREALVHKVKLDYFSWERSCLIISVWHNVNGIEETEDELADFVALFNYLSTTMKESDEKGRSSTRSSSGSSMGTDSEIQRLKLEYNKVASEKDAVSREKSFIWNQFNILETNMTKRLKDKQAEVDQSNAKIAHVLATAEQLQCSNNDKDETIEKLKARVREMEKEGIRWEEKVSKLSQGLEGLKKHKPEVVTPVLRSCKEKVAKTGKLKGA